MHKKLLRPGLCLLFALTLCCCSKEKEKESLAWNLDRVESEGENDQNKDIVIEIRTPETESREEPAETTSEEIAAQALEETEKEPVPDTEEEEFSGNGEENLRDPETGEPVRAVEENHPVTLDPGWQYADYSKINSGAAILYAAPENRKNRIIGVNAGHGTKGGEAVKTWSHPDHTPKVTGGTNANGAIESAAISSGMTFSDGTPEAEVTLRMAELLRDELLLRGYDVLMLRDGKDVQLDNIARTVIANNVADCHISLHWDGDGLDYDKGCFYISVPEGIKNMEPVKSHWQEHERLGKALIDGLSSAGFKLHNNGSMAIDLTQTSYSTIPSVDIELGNQAGAHDDPYLAKLAAALSDGIELAVN